MMKLGVMAVFAIVMLGGAGLALADDPGPPAEQGPPTASEDTRININEAGVDQLVTLPGIGPSRAEAIVAEREKRRFRRVEDIMRVPGIGRKTFGRIRASIRVR